MTISFQTVESRNEFVKDTLKFTHVEPRHLLDVLGYTHLQEVYRGRAIKYNALHNIAVCYISMTSETGYRDYFEEEGFVMYQGEGQRGDQVMTRGNRLLEPENTAVMIIVCTGDGNWFYRTGLRIGPPRYGPNESGNRQVYHFKIEVL
jgi:hypothetical protein